MLINEEMPQATGQALTLQKLSCGDDMFYHRNFKQYKSEVESGEFEKISFTEYYGLFECRCGDDGPVCISHVNFETFHGVFHSVLRMFKGQRILFVCSIDYFVYMWERVGMTAILNYYKAQGYKVVVYDHETHFTDSIWNYGEWFKNGWVPCDDNFEQYMPESGMHLTAEPTYDKYMRSIFKWLDVSGLADEIWTFSIYNMLDYGSNPSIPVKYYIPIPPKVYDYTSEEKPIDIFFYGNTDSKYRQELTGALEWLAEKKHYKFKMMTNSNHNEDINQCIRQSKIVVNIPGWEGRLEGEPLRMYQVLGNQALLLTQQCPASTLIYSNVPFYYANKNDLLLKVQNMLSCDNWRYMLAQQQGIWQELAKNVASKIK